MKSTGFAIPENGRMKKYPLGAEVPDDIVKAGNLLQKGLVEPAAGVSSAGASAASTPPVSEDEPEEDKE